MLFGTWDGKFGDSTFMLVQAVMGGGGGRGGSFLMVFYDSNCTN